MPSREDAWRLVCEYTQSESLRKHMLAVETCVRAYARKSGADEELWGLTALLHDFDYERWPNADHAPDREHPAEGAKILRERGYSEELIRAVMSHADYCNTPRPPRHYRSSWKALISRPLYYSAAVLTSDCDLNR